MAKKRVRTPEQREQRRLYQQKYRAKRKALATEGKIPEKKGNGGRHSVYDPERHPQQAYQLVSRYGHYDMDLAPALGITPVTLWHWQQQHPEFLDAVNKGWDDFAHNRVKKSLAARAIGYSHPDEKVFINIIDGEPVVTRVPTTKHYPPETAAAIFWLCNYSRRWGNDEWQQVQRYEHTGKDGGPIQVQQAQLNVLLTELQQQASAAFDPKALRDQIIALPPTNGEGRADDDG